MNVDIALKIFTLGVRHGHKQTVLGMTIGKSSDEFLSLDLLEAFRKDEDEIRRYAEQLRINSSKRSFYAEHFTAKAAFRFGCLEGFEVAKQIAPDKNGIKILTDDVIDHLTKNHFKDTI